MPVRAQEWVRDSEAGEEVLIMEELPQALRREVGPPPNEAACFGTQLG